MSKLKQTLDSFSWNKLDPLAPVVLLILILILCWKIASFFWLVIAPPQVIQPEQVTLGSQQSNVPNIGSFALFQEVGASPDENITIQLQGVVLGQPRHLSSAVIKVNDISDRYLVGEKLESSAYELSEVYWDHIVLRHGNGSTKEIKFLGIENLNQPIALDQKQTGSSTSNSAPSSQAKTENNQNQSMLGQAIGQIEENREQYLKNMGVNTSGGQGYEVTDQTPSALRNKLGLRTGDRILSLNGQAVGQGQSDAQLLEQVKKEGKVKIEVKRGDQVMTFQQDL